MFPPYAPRVTTSPRCPFGPAPEAYASRCSLPNRLARVRRGLTPEDPSSLENLLDSLSFVSSLCPHFALPAPAPRVARHRDGPGRRRAGRFRGRGSSGLNEPARPTRTEVSGWPVSVLPVLVHIPHTPGLVPTGILCFDSAFLINPAYPRQNFGSSSCYFLRSSRIAMESNASQRGPLSRATLPVASPQALRATQ